jgi:hypothetical protein
VLALVISRPKLVILVGRGCLHKSFLWVMTLHKSFFREQLKIKDKIENATKVRWKDKIFLGFSFLAKL